MRVLIIGSGGREHALAWKLGQSPLVRELQIAPGNGGTGREGKNVALGADDIQAIVRHARTNAIDLVVAGPELPLVLGLSDALADARIKCFGPTAYGAQLEGSKAFAKKVMREAGVPTADFEVFTDVAKAREYVKAKGAPLVVKADGLAAGKGVVVAKDVDEALEALEDMMVRKSFGKAGETVVIEEALAGEEASFLAFCDGRTIVPMPSSQDHKRVGDDDTGPNTGGMGAYSPAPILPESRYNKTANMVIRPIVEHMAAAGHPFKGVLYAGLMYTADGPKVLEYNVRFGDPECQPLLARLDSDLAEVMLACCEGRLDEIKVRWKKDTACCVVMAAGGYPGKYEKGKVIKGIDEAEKVPGVKVFHAGTKAEDGSIVTAGGRVLGVTALGKDLAQARERAYQGTERISFEGAQFRHDIGNKGLTRKKHG